MFPAGAGAHAERQAFFPDPNLGDFPQYRTEGPTKVVCRKESRREILNIEDHAVRRANQKLLAKCRFQSIQMAINYSTNGTRILVLPGEYKEVRWTGPPPPNPRRLHAHPARR